MLMSRDTSRCETQLEDISKHVLTFTFRTPSVWYESCAKLQQHASEHPLLPPTRAHSSLLIHHTSQSMRQTVINPPTTATQLIKYVQLPPRAPSEEACPDDNTHAFRLLPPIALMLATPLALPSSHFTYPCLPPRSEKAKMLSEEPFLPNTAQLVDGRKLSLQP
jgi:hypothetical protein